MKYLQLDSSYLVSIIYSQSFEYCKWLLILGLHSSKDQLDNTGDCHLLVCKTGSFFLTHMDNCIKEAIKNGHIVYFGFDTDEFFKVVEQQTRKAARNNNYWGEDIYDETE